MVEFKYRHLLHSLNIIIGTLSCMFSVYLYIMFILYISELLNFLSLSLIASTILVVSTISHSTDHMVESFHRHTITKLSGEVLYTRHFLHLLCM